MYWHLGVIPEDHTVVTIQDFFINDAAGKPTEKRVTNVLGSMKTAAKELPMKQEDKLKLFAEMEDASKASAFVALLAQF